MEGVAANIPTSPEPPALPPVICRRPDCVLARLINAEVQTISRNRNRRKDRWGVRGLIAAAILAIITAAATAFFTDYFDDDPPAPDDRPAKLDLLLASATSSADVIDEILDGPAPSPAQQERLADGLTKVLTACAPVLDVCEDQPFFEHAAQWESRDGVIPRPDLRSLQKEAVAFVAYLRAHLDEDPPYEEGDLCCSDTGKIEFEARRPRQRLPDERAQAPDPAEAQHLSPVRRKPVSRPARGGRHADDLARERLARGSP